MSEGETPKMTPSMASEIVMARLYERGFAADAVEWANSQEFHARGATLRPCILCHPALIRRNHTRRSLRDSEPSPFANLRRASTHASTVIHAFVPCFPRI